MHSNCQKLSGFVSPNVRFLTFSGYYNTNYAPVIFFIIIKRKFLATKKADILLGIKIAINSLKEPIIKPNTYVSVVKLVRSAKQCLP